MPTLVGEPVFAPFRGCANHHFSGGYDLPVVSVLGFELLFGIIHWLEDIIIVYLFVNCDEQS